MFWFEVIIPSESHVGPCLEGKTGLFPRIQKHKSFFPPVLFLPSLFSRNINTTPCTFSSPHNSAVFCRTEYSNKLLVCFFGWGNKIFPEFYPKKMWNVTLVKKTLFVALLDLDSVRRSMSGHVYRWHSNNLFLPFLSGPPCVIRKCGTTPALLQPYLESAKMSSKKCIFGPWRVRIIVKQRINEHRAYTVFPLLFLPAAAPQPRRAARLSHVWINVRLNGFTSHRHTVSQDDFCTESYFQPNSGDFVCQTSLRNAAFLQLHMGLCSPAMK